jgi:hypothetical protein
MNNPIDSIFDTRDLIEYIDFLETEFVQTWNNTYKRYYKLRSILSDNPEDLPFEVATDIDDIDLENIDFTDRLDYEQLDEYNGVMELQNELEQTDDYRYGITVIREDHFTDYCKEFLQDCGYIKKDMPYWIEIDYESTANNMKADYTEVEYDGDTYYAR